MAKDPKELLADEKIDRAQAEQAAAAREGRPVRELDFSDLESE